MTFEIVEPRRKRRTQHEMSVARRAAVVLGQNGFSVSQIIRLTGINLPGLSQSKHDDARVHRMAEMYKSGKTLAEIGDEFGLSRERVRQLIRLIVKKSGGGRCVAAQQRAAIEKQERQKSKDARCRELFGCDHVTASRLNLGLPLSPNTATRASGYLNQKRVMSNLYRGVEWSLTFPEWLAAWGDKYSMKGRGKWALCRIDPTKGFIAGNVQPMEMKEKARATIARTRSRMEQIRSLKEAGMSNEQIANQLGLSENYLSSLSFYGRRMTA